MSLLHQDDDHGRDEYGRDEPERELTLSTGALLGIFIGLVLLCALFFALGYTVRGKQTPRPAIATTTEQHAPSSSANFNSFKPAAGSLAGIPSTAPAPPPPHSQPTAAPPPPATEPATPSHPSAAAPLAPITRPPAPSTSVPVPIPVGSFVVQVAAVSHPEDAQYVVAALKAKGYPAVSRTEPQDKLFHIQVGPYTDRKEAEAIKQRLSADGYNNPIVK